MAYLATLLVALGGLDRVTDTGAIDEDAFLAVRLARPGKTRIDIFIAGDIDLAEDATDVLGNRLALFLVHVEDGDLRPLRGNCAGGSFAEAGGPTGDDCGGIATDFHEYSSQSLYRIRPWPVSFSHGFETEFRFPALAGLARFVKAPRR